MAHQSERSLPTRFNRGFLQKLDHPALKRLLASSARITRLASWPKVGNRLRQALLSPACLALLVVGASADNGNTSALARTGTFERLDLIGDQALYQAENLRVIAQAANATQQNDVRLDPSVQRLVDAARVRAQSYGIADDLLIAIARRYSQGTPDDLNAAFLGLVRALDVAYEQTQRERSATELGDTLMTVLHQMDALNRRGDIDAARDALIAAVAVMEAEGEQNAAVWSAFLEANLVQAILTRNITATADSLYLRETLDTPDILDLLEGVKATRLEWALRGSQEGLHFELEVAIHLSHILLELVVPRDLVSLLWAESQVGLGDALLDLGLMESGTARLEEAAVSYRLALEELTEESLVPLRMVARNHLGYALSNIGERRSDPAPVEEAITFFRLVLEEISRPHGPHPWAVVQNRLGHALTLLGKLEREPIRFEEAIIAFHLGHEEFTRDYDAFLWAAVQQNLAIALTHLGESESGTGRLEEAVSAYRLAREEVTPDRNPEVWADIHFWLGGTLHILGQRQNGTEELEEALQSTRVAADLYRKLDDHERFRRSDILMVDIQTLIETRNRL